VKLGIKEPVGSFTTRHKPGEARVSNIHRISDIVRGAVVAPGATFSVNDFVGKRTVEKGFVTAPVIQNGEHDEDVGGGVSQFATTLFNASFFAGLDFGEYQSHSLYISRYPYGREATMGFPHPDLQVKNTTPFGVLIWPTYTGTSITITLYSTHFVDAAQTKQTKSLRGSCTVVTTERSRKYPDGTTRTDSVRATYRAAEGQDCNEDHPTLTTPTTVKPGPTTTLAPGAPTTTAKPGAATTTPTTVKTTPTTLKKTTATTAKKP
jgi:vancomycin resistance protein YoaR